MKKMILSLSLLAFSQFVHPQSVGCFQDSCKSPRVALVLSGGGALGYAHIGVLQALDEAGIRPCFIAGTSMGAIVGAVYAQGYTGDELYDFVKERRLHNIFRNVNASMRHPNLGIGSYRRVRQLLNDAIPHDSFDQLSIPFLCVATNLNTNMPEVRSSGSQLADWVLASASIPVVFKPQLIDGVYYCDGGFTDNLPACHIPRDAYDICIGIDLVPSRIPSTDDFFSRNYRIDNVYGNMILSINSHKGRACCDHIITPHQDVAYGILDFRHYEILRQRGYDAMKRWLSEWNH